MNPEKSVQERRWTILGCVALATLMFTIDSSGVNIALPTLSREFHVRFLMVQWVVLSYLLGITVLLLIAARLGDLFGQKKLYLAGLAVFTLSSLLCGCSPNVGVLIGFRALQGLGGVFMAALGMAIVAKVFPATERGMALGTMGAVVSVGVAIGPSVGGWLISMGGWRLIFFINVPMGILTLLLIFRLLPADSPVRSGPFDIRGSLLWAAAVGMFSMGMTRGQMAGFDSVSALTLLAGSAVALAFFLRHEKNAADPMLDLGLFSSPVISGALGAGLVVYGVVMGTTFLLPFYLSLVKHYPVWQVGLLMVVIPGGMGIVAPFAGALSDRMGSRPIVLTGLFFIAAGCWLIAHFKSDLSMAGFIFGAVIFGAGLGFFTSPNTSQIMGAAPKERLGTVSGLVSLTRMLGQTIGVPLFGSIFSEVTHRSGHLAHDIRLSQAPPDAVVAGLRFAMLAGFAMILMVLILAAFRSSAGNIGKNEKEPDFF
ncbi:MAG: MFS transporter [Verrucomicrobiae bacterium]|nr:MFS transporter [Verrucomicrobiae bacterium]